MIMYSVEIMPKLGFFNLGKYFRNKKGEII